MDIETKINLIKNGSVELVDILTEKELIRLLETKQHPISYWGIATSGPLHIGYLKPINKQLDLLRAGFKHKVLIADIHAYLDDIKCPWDLLEIRTKYYKKCLELLLPEKVEFIIASSFQTSEKYIKDLYKALALVTTNRALRAASEICRIKGTPHVSELTYPLLQVIDQIYLNVDISYGGLDQRHAYALGRELIPKLGYKNAPVSIFTDRSPGLLKNTNMSASQPNTTIQLHESEYEIENKIRQLKKMYPVKNDKYQIFRPKWSEKFCSNRVWKQEFWDFFLNQEFLIKGNYNKNIDFSDGVPINFKL